MALQEVKISNKQKSFSANLTSTRNPNLINFSFLKLLKPRSIKFPILNSTFKNKNKKKQLFFDNQFPTSSWKTSRNLHLSLSKTPFITHRQSNWNRLLRLYQLSEKSFKGEAKVIHNEHLINTHYLDLKVQSNKANIAWKQEKMKVAKATVSIIKK